MKIEFVVSCAGYSATVTAPNHIIAIRKFLNALGKQQKHVGKFSGNLHVESKRKNINDPLTGKEYPNAKTS